jgi:hypothetical protein
MPPYKANKSKAQQRFMFVLEKEGKLKPGEAAGKARASKGKRLPEHVKHRKKK